MASLNKLMSGPLATNVPMYNPATAQQYAPNTALPGSNLLQSLLVPGGLNAATGLKTGWAPDLSNIQSNAATAKKRKTANPFMAAPTGLKSKNPFVISQTPSADLFGLNIPT